jgi:hypothetical protein
MSQLSDTAKGVSNAWDFYLSQREVSIPATIEKAVRDAFTRWLDSQATHLIPPPTYPFLSYNYATRIGQLHVDPSSCADMADTIALFERIDPGVTLIRTFARERPDTLYQRDQGEWIAHF